MTRTTNIAQSANSNASELDALRTNESRSVGRRLRPMDGANNRVALWRTALIVAVLGILKLCVLPASLYAQATAFQGLESVVMTGLNYANGLAVDNAGNVFIAEYNSGRVWEVPAGGGTPRVVAESGLVTPSALALDKAGNLYIADLGAEKVFKVAPGSGVAVPLPIAGRDLDPDAVAVDAAGDVFVALFSSNGGIIKLPAGGGPQVSVGERLLEPVGLAVDSAGNLFVAVGGAPSVVEIPANGGPQSTIPTSGVAYPTGVAVDPIGNVFIIDEASRVVEEPAGGGAQQTVIGGLGGSGAIAVDGDGRIFVTDLPNGQANSSVLEMQTRSIDFVSLPVCGSPATLKKPCSQTVTFNATLLNAATASPSVATLGASGLDFTLAKYSCSPETEVLTSCTFDVTFAPKHPGLREGAFQLTNGAGGPVLLTVPLFGTGVSPQIAFSSAAENTIPASGLDNPTAVALDGQGNAYIVDAYNNRVVKVPAGGGAQTTVGTGLANPLGVAIDGAGDVFIADWGNKRVVDVPVDGSAQTTVASGIGAAGIAIDGEGNMFVADYTNNRVVKIPAEGGPETTVGSGLVGPRGIAVDAAEDVFIASGDNGLVVKVPGKGGPQVEVGTGLSAPYGVAVDAAGDVFIADYGASTVVEVPAGGGPQTTMGTGLTNPDGIALDPAGNVWIADTANHRVLELTRSQPQALSFAATAIGTTSNDSPRIVAIENSGNQSLSLTNVSYPADFPRANGAVNKADLCTSTSSLAAGQVCYLPVDFAPRKTGTLNESLTITDNTLVLGSSTQSIALSGQGLPNTQLLLSATSLSFGAVKVTKTSAWQTVTLTNNGIGYIYFGGIKLIDAEASSFTVENTCGTKLAGGAHCVINVLFAPKAVAALTAAVEITDDIAGSPQFINLSGAGTGITTVSLSTTTLSFGAVKVKSSSAPQAITLTNTGSAVLSISSIKLIGANASSFVFTSTCGKTLAVHGFCALRGHFAPTTAGTLKAEITITDDAITSPQTIALSGTGQ